jgi:hypothetical protein
MTIVSAMRRFTLGAVLSGVGVCLVGGCASSDRPKEVPQSALYKAGGDERVVFVADQDGTLYVTEEGPKSVLYSGRVMRGDRVVIDPDSDRLTVNERVVFSKDIPKRMHKVFVQPGDVSPVTPAESASVRETARPAGVPLTAALGGEGEDRLEYRAPQDGEFWVVDADAGRNADAILYTGQVRAGERVAVDPQRDQITVDNRVVYEKDLGERNRRIFYAPGSSRRANLPLAPGSPPASPPAAAPARWDELRDGAGNRPAPPRPGEVPATAILRGEQAGAQDFVADSDGTVWVVNSTTGRLAYQSQMRRNDRLQVSPAGNEITLNGRRASAQPLSGDRYRIYFQPSAAQ